MIVNCNQKKLRFKLKFKKFDDSSNNSDQNFEVTRNLPKGCGKSIRIEADQ